METQVAIAFGASVHPLINTTATTRIIAIINIGYSLISKNNVLKSICKKL